MSKVKSMGFYEAEGVAAAESLPASQTLETFCIRAPVIFPGHHCESDFVWVDFHLPCLSLPRGF